MGFVKTDNVRIFTKDGIKPIKEVKKVFVPSLGRYVIKECKYIKGDKDYGII